MSRKEMVMANLKVLSGNPHGETEKPPNTSAKMQIGCYPFTSPFNEGVNQILNIRVQVIK